MNGHVEEPRTVPGKQKTESWRMSKVSLPCGPQSVPKERKVEDVAASFL